MSVLYLLLPLMLAIASGAVIGFVWAAHGEQLDDLDTPPLRMLADDDDPTGSTRP
jgi:cbb3-type cytochrome oxidase maturation protein